MEIGAGVAALDDSLRAEGSEGAGGAGKGGGEAHFGRYAFPWRRGLGMVRGEEGVKGG